MKLASLANIEVADHWDTAQEDIGGAVFINSPCEEARAISFVRMKHALAKETGGATATAADLWTTVQRHPELRLSRHQATDRESRRRAHLEQFDMTKIDALSKRFKRDLRKTINEQLWRI